MFSQCPVRWRSSVRSIEDDEVACTGLWLCPVWVHRTHPVAIPGVLDFSGIDRMLGGSVRSLPSERPVNRNRADCKLFLCFLFNPTGDPFIIEHRHDPCPTSAPQPSPSRRLHTAAAPPHAPVLPSYSSPRHCSSPCRRTPRAVLLCAVPAHHRSAALHPRAVMPCRVSQNRPIYKNTSTMEIRKRPHCHT